MRHGLLHLTLDVPTDDQLLDWANTVHKPLSGHVTFFEDDRRTARETVSFAAGQCVSYQESFVAGDGEAGAYVCQLLITSAGLTLAPGRPAQAFVAPAAREYAPTSPVAVPAGPLAPLPTISPEYTLAEFTKTIGGINQVAPEIGEQLYQHFNAAKASVDPTPHWAAMETLIRSTTYVDPKSQNITVLNMGWPPANGGVNKRIVSLTPPAVYDRYQKEVKVDEEGLPILGGTFTSPIPATGPYDYEARALDGKENEYDLSYEIEILKPLPFDGEEADIIPWHGHTGNGVQTKMLFPRDPVTGGYPWSWKILEEQGYIKIRYKDSPSGKFEILPNNQVRLKK